MRLGDIFANVNDALEKAFRKKVARYFGTKQGALKKGVEDAIRLWLSERKNKIVQ